MLMLPDNIDALLVAMREVTMDARANPMKVTNEFVMALDEVFRTLLIHVINARFNPQGMSVYLSAISLTNDILPLIEPKETSQEYTWRWGGFFDVAKSYSDIIIAREKAQVGSVFNPNRIGISLQSKMKTDANGNTTVVEERVGFLR